MSHQKTNNLDFSLLPKLDRYSAFMQLPPAVDQELSRLAATYDRARGALHFCARIGNTPSSEDGSDVKRRETCMRAALGEYVSMEETIHWDRPGDKHPRIRDSRNPLLHIIKELRNLQFHLLSSPLESRQQSVIYASRECDLCVWYVEDLSVARFRLLRNAEHFRPDDQSRMIQWFNENQRSWGVAELILLAVGAYAEEILA